MSHPLTNFDASSGVLETASGTPDAQEISAEPGRWRGATAIVAAGFAALAIATVALAGEYHSNPWLLSWISASCCVTNDCCWQISESELRAMPGDKWEVRSTGQVRERTDWSPDGKFYRCACDYDSADRHWVRHQGANTRCIFVPMRTAGL